MPPRFDSYLIVEPHGVGRRLLELFCQKTANRVKAVTNGEAALALSAAPYSYDCMIIECRLPGMDGLEVSEALRTGAAYPSLVPFLVGMTADLHRYDREQCLAAGMDDFLEKPFGLDDLKCVLGL